MVADSGALREHFLAALDIGLRPDFARLALEDFLTTILNEAREMWPGVQVSDHRFVEYLAERATIESGQPELPPCGHDLYLALACLQGDLSALDFFESAVLMKVGAVLSRLGFVGSDAEDILQDLRARLLVGTKERGAVLESYLGLGSLTGWVRAVAGRQALMHLRSSLPNRTSSSVMAPRPCSSTSDWLQCALARAPLSVLVDFAIATCAFELGDESTRESTVKAIVKVREDLATLAEAEVLEEIDAWLAEHKQWRRATERPEQTKPI